MRQLIINTKTILHTQTLLLFFNFFLFIAYVKSLSGGICQTKNKLVSSFYFHSVKEVISPRTDHRIIFRIMIAYSFHLIYYYCLHTVDQFPNNS